MFLRLFSPGHSIDCLQLRCEGGGQTSKCIFAKGIFAKGIFVKCIFVKCIFPNCIFAKCTQPLHLLSCHSLIRLFATLRWEGGSDTQFRWCRRYQVSGIRYDVAGTAEGVGVRWSVKGGTIERGTVLSLLVATGCVPSPYSLTDHHLLCLGELVCAWVYLGELVCVWVYLGVLVCAWVCSVNTAHPTLLLTDH